MEPTFIKREPQDAFPPSSPTLDTLPAEIINCIARHVRSITQDVDDYTPRIPRVCPCLPITSLKRAEAQVKSLGHYQDAALALSETCKRLREIVFGADLQRGVKIRFCDAAATETQGMSEDLRSHVRTLQLQANAQHASPSLVIQLNDYLRIFPSLRKLEIEWELYTDALR